MLSSFYWGGFGRWIRARIPPPHTPFPTAALFKATGGVWVCAIYTETSNGLWRRGGPFGGNADCGRKRKPREKFPAAGPGGNPRRKRGKKTLPNAFFFLPFFKRWRRRGLTAAVYKREHPSRPGPTHPTRVSNSPQSVQGNPFGRRLFHLSFEGRDSF